MDNLIEAFNNLSLDMEEYYIKDFTEFYEDFGFSHQQAIQKAKQAAKEQIAIDREAAKKRKKAEMRKRVIEWLKIKRNQKFKDDVIDEISDLIDKLSV